MKEPAIGRLPKRTRFSGSDAALPHAPAPGSCRLDRAALLGALLLLALWEFTGLDLWLIRPFASADGFPMRDVFITSELLHTGGRRLAAVVAVAQLVDVVLPLVAGPARRTRLMWFGVTVACIVLVPALKHLSSTSCPWDLLEFGGSVPYVPHWLAGTVDGGPGHCFPSGHAVSAFAFLSIYFLWREHRPRFARWALALVLVAGVSFGAVQMLRGAHFASHSLWSGWLCWALCVSAAGATQTLSQRPAAAAVTRMRAWR